MFEHPHLLDIYYIAWGDFDIQGTIAYTLPTDERKHIGTSLVTSTTLQYHVGEYFWPEFALQRHAMDERRARRQKPAVCEPWHNVWPFSDLQPCEV
jgi:hypothetical protein